MAILTQSNWTLVEQSGALPSATIPTLSPARGRVLYEGESCKWSEKPVYDVTGGGISDVALGCEANQTIRVSGLAAAAALVWWFLKGRKS
jgi:hypothetical protein